MEKSYHGQESSIDESIPGEWDEFDKVKPMHKGPNDTGETKNSLDNPENADGETNSVDKKEVDYQLQQEFIQISFKVN